MPSDGPTTFHDHFQDLTDPRVERTRKHPLINIAFIAVCAVLSGANSFAAIHEFGTDRRTWLTRFLDMTNGIPSEDTFRRVLRGSTRPRSRRLSGAGCRRCRRSPAIAWSPSTARRCAARTTSGTARRRSIWSRPGPPRTSCRWGRSLWTRSRTRSRRSPRALSQNRPLQAVAGGQFPSGRVQSWG